MPSFFSFFSAVFTIYQNLHTNIRVAESEFVVTIHRQDLSSEFVVGIVPEPVIINKPVAELFNASKDLAPVIVIRSVV